MSSPPVHHVDVRAFCYATEVPERVQSALTALHPAIGDDDDLELTVTPSTGHYGNPIDIYEVRLERSDTIETVFERIRDHGDIDTLHSDLPARVTEECDLFIRFDKQRAYTDGELVFGDGIEVRLRIEAYPAKREAAIENLREYLTDLGVDT